MTRLYGWAPKGQRACGKVPCNTDPNLTLIFGLGLRGVLEPLVFEGAMNGGIFEPYIREKVAPLLRPGDVVLVDGLSAHRTQGVREAIEARGARYWFLPAYSPDLTPIENCGSKIKEALRAEAPRTVADVINAIGRALRKVTPQDIKGWFRHAGYPRRARRPTSRRASSLRKPSPRRRPARAPPSDLSTPRERRRCTKRARPLL
jgi:transposase